MTAFQNPLMVALARTVKERRFDLGLSQDELAGIMRTSLSTIKDIEDANAIVSFATFKALAEALRLKENELFSYGVEKSSC